MNQDIDTVNRDATATLALAASIVDRTYSLLQDGWVQGTMSSGFGKIEQFCIHGAMNLALNEMFGNAVNCSAIEALATAYIVDEAQVQYNYKGSWKTGSIPAAGFNDAPGRKLDEVLKVLGTASKRLWDLSLLDETKEDKFEFSKWADVEQVDENVKYQFLHQQLV